MTIYSAGFGWSEAGDGPQGQYESPRRKVNAADLPIEMQFVDHPPLDFLDESMAKLCSQFKLVKVLGSGFENSRYSENVILSVDPWSPNVKRYPKEFQGKQGSTDYWASAWCFGVSDGLFKPLKRPERMPTTTLRLSGVTWSCREEKTSLTSIVFMIWSSGHYVDAGQAPSKHQSTIAKMKPKVEALFKA